MLSKKLKGFTIIELLVSMAIIGIILALSLFGISAAQRNSRDTQRRGALKDIAAGLIEYQTKYNIQPNQLAFNQAGTTSPYVDVIRQGVATYRITVPLNDSANPVQNIVLQSGTPNMTTAQDSSSSKYCYEPQSDGYSLGVCLENETIFDQSTSATKCSMTCP